MGKDERLFAGVSIRLDHETEKRIDRIARRTKRRRGQVAREALLAGLAAIETSKGVDRG